MRVLLIQTPPLLKRTFLSATLCASVALALPFAARAQTVSTMPSWTGSGVLPWGPASDPVSTRDTYGQSLSAPTDSIRLDSFTFQLAGANRGTADGTLRDTNYQAYVYQFNSVTRAITGPALWSSGTQNISSLSMNQYQAFTFNPNIAVTGGTQYMLFLTTLGETQPPT